MRSNKSKQNINNPGHGYGYRRTKSMTTRTTWSTTDDKKNHYKYLRERKQPNQRMVETVEGMVHLKDLNAHWKCRIRWKALSKLCFECFVKCFTLNQRVASLIRNCAIARMRAASLDFFSHEICNWSLDHIMFIVRLVLFFISQPTSHIFIITNSTILLSIDPNVLTNNWFGSFVSVWRKKFSVGFFSSPSSSSAKCHSFCSKSRFASVTNILRTVNYYYIVWHKPRECNTKFEKKKNYVHEMNDWNPASNIKWVVLIDVVKT